MGRDDERAGHVRKLRDIARAAHVEYVSKDLCFRRAGTGGGGRARARHLATSFRFVGRYTWNCTGLNITNQ